MVISFGKSISIHSLMKEALILETQLKVSKEGSH